MGIFRKNVNALSCFCNCDGCVNNTGHCNSWRCRI